MAIEKRDWVLLAISSTEGEHLSPVQLQKSLFIFGQLMPESVADDYYEFEPYHYGPFCQAIYSDVEDLERDEYVVSRIPLGRRWREYSITGKGMERAVELRSEVPGDEFNFLARVVNWTRQLSFPQLIREIYQRYPEFKVNSVFQS